MISIGKFASLAALALTLGAAAPARAADEIVASGALYGSKTQKRAVCYITNVGNSSIKIKNHQILDNRGVAFTPAIDDCSRLAEVLPRLSTCGFAADVENNVFVTCRTLVSVTNRPFLRGAIEMRDADENVLNSLPMQ